MVLPTEDWAFFHQLAINAPSDMTIGQSDGGKFSFGVSASNICQVDNQISPLKVKAIAYFVFSLSGGRQRRPCEKGTNCSWSLDRGQVSYAVEKFFFWSEECISSSWCMLPCLPNKRGRARKSRKSSRRLTSMLWLVSWAVGEEDEGGRQDHGSSWSLKREE